MAHPLLSIVGPLLGSIIKKTVSPNEIKENAKQTSTKFAGLLAGIAATPSAVEVAQTGNMLPQSEGELIFQAITAIAAVVMYYIDQRKLSQTPEQPK